MNLSLEQRRAQTDALLSELAHADAPGTAVLVSVGGEVIYRQGFGMADLGTNEAISPQTNFRLASVSKQITAMAVMLLVEEGQLGYDDSMVEHLPQLKAYGTDLTVRNLLQHTAGLPDAYERAAQNGSRPLNADLIPALVDIGQPVFAPGERFDYCNICYDMLALIVENVSQQSFDTFLRERIFAPLGMDASSTFQCPEPQISHRALGYRPAARGFEEYDADPLNCILGAGGIYSNLDDLHRWTEGLHQATLVPPETIQKSLTPGHLKDGAGIDYGFGWVLDTYRNVRRASHTGSWVGFRNYVAVFPDTGMTIILLSNRSDYKRQRLAERIADLYLDLAVSTPSPQ